MGYGSTGRLLRVDLTRGIVSVEEFDEAFYRLYPGGKALAGYLLLREIEPGADPLGPDNVLVLVNGLLTGAPISTATRFTASARSPLTGAYGESEAGGFWGPELKMAGYEGIIVTGRAEHPVYIAIKDDQVEIRDARHLWGQEPEQAQAIMREEMSDRLVRVLQIGAGGENTVHFAALINDLRHFNGRTGMGAVMGSKNLKGIAVRGSHKFLDYAHDPAAVSELGRRLPKRVKEQPQSYELQYRGTPGLVAGLNAGGILPTRNFHQGAFEGVDNIKWEVYEKELLTARRSCYACAVRCKREVSVNDRYQVTDAYGGPEYETISGFGSNCGIDDLQAIAKANELCGRYTLDAISTSSVVAFAMECYEHGLIGPQDTGGLELRFGDAPVMLKLVEMIAHRQGIGNLLADGVRRAAEAIGGDARTFAMHVKGQELPMHDPRGKTGQALSFAVSPTGADHIEAPHDPFYTGLNPSGDDPLSITGMLEPTDPLDMSPKKVELFYHGQLVWSLYNCIGMCNFAGVPLGPVPLEVLLEHVCAVTGWNTSLFELFKVAERSSVMARIFNYREGFTKDDDYLPEILHQPLENGKLKGHKIDKEKFKEFLTTYYEAMGWNAQTGYPTRGKLAQLDLLWVEKVV